VRRLVTARDLLRGGARNNAWANHRLLGACAQLTAEELHATRTSFFPTIMRTLNHILIVDWYYVDALARGGKGRSVFANEEPFADLGALRAAQRTSDLQLVALVEAMRDGDELAEVRLERADRVQKERAADMLMHLYEHQIHHRGQVHAMLAGTRVAPPQLDEFFMAEELPLRARELDELGLPHR
jgi:uncharacterized damage-inducible protein DinB